MKKVPSKRAAMIDNALSNIYEIFKILHGMQTKDLKIYIKNSLLFLQSWKVTYVNTLQQSEKTWIYTLLSTKTT